MLQWTKGQDLNADVIATLLHKCRLHHDRKCCVSHILLINDPIRETGVLFIVIFCVLICEATDKTSVYS